LKIKPETKSLKPPWPWLSLSTKIELNEKKCRKVKEIQQQ